MPEPDARHPAARPVPAAPARTRARPKIARRGLLAGGATAALVAALAAPCRPAAAEAPFSDGTWFADGSGWA
jgi:hypothetical protein